MHVNAHPRSTGPSNVPPSRTDTVLIPVSTGDPDATVEMAPPWLKPPVTARHLTLHGRARRAWYRMLRRRTVEDRRPLLAAARAAFWPLTIGCGLLVGLALYVAAPYLATAAAIR